MGYFMNREPADFYDNIAADYDEMTRYTARLHSEKEKLAAWIDRYAVRTVLDAACGSGLHAILLSEMGVKVTAADISHHMLEKARNNAKSAGVTVEWVYSAMQKLSENINTRVNAVLCLGNSLPHLLPGKDLEAAVAGFYNMLEPGGVAVIQILNYQRILQRKDRIIGIHRQGENEYIRFYDFLGETVRFNILTVHSEGERVSQQLLSTELYPYRRKELDKALRLSGFKNLEFFGNMQFAEFDEEKSPNLVVTAKKL